MRRIASLKNDTAGRARAKFALMALIALPLLYPTKTLSIIDHAQAKWEHVWTVDLGAYRA